MSSSNWDIAVNAYATALRDMIITTTSGAVNIDYGFSKLFDLTNLLRSNNGTIYLIGNGASASMASHLSADLAKNARIHTQVFSDLSLITAMANDISYEDVFAEPLKTRACKGDMLVAISSSGESPNVLKATRVAKELGVTVVTYSGFSENNTLRKSGDINFYVDVDTYGAVESCHSMILHHWMDMVSL